MPLVLKGQGKKVIAITSGHGDPLLAKDFGIRVSAPYAISKSALNTTIAKFHATYAPQGILFMAVCPGVFSTDNAQGKSSPTCSAVEDAGSNDFSLAPVTEREQTNGADTGAQFMRLGPGFKGPAPVEVPASKILEVIGRANLAAGYGGMFISHMGLQTWLPQW